MQFYYEIDRKNFFYTCCISLFQSTYRIDGKVNILISVINIYDTFNDT